MQVVLGCVFVRVLLLDGSPVPSGACLRFQLSCCLGVDAAEVEQQPVAQRALFLRCRRVGEGPGQLLLPDDSEVRWLGSRAVRLLLQAGLEILLCQADGAVTRWAQPR